MVEWRVEGAWVVDLWYVFVEGIFRIQRLSKLCICSLQYHTLPIPHILEMHIFKLIAPPATPTISPRLLTARFPQRVLDRPHGPLEEPTYEPPALFHFVVRSDPVFRTQNSLRLHAVLCAKVQLLGGGYADVVEAVEEGEGFELGVGFGDGAQRGVRDAVGGVDDGLCCLAGARREAPL